MELVKAYRIVPKKFAGLAFDPAKAEASEGRWNGGDVLLFYAADSRSLAALECLAHLDRPKLAEPHCIVRVQFPDTMVKRLRPADLPPQWCHPQPAKELRLVGDTWAKSRESAVLCVPSAIVRAECNYLINPHHPDFAKLQVDEPQEFHFDPRLMT